MPVRSVSFDDDSDSPLYVFSGSDLLLSHYDSADLDWEQVAERSLIDQRRGLVIAQVAVLEDLIDEFILYLEDPPDTDEFRKKQLNRTIGPRLDRLERALDREGLLDNEAAECVEAARRIVSRRHRLAHSTLECRMAQVVPIPDLADRDVDVEWVFVDRRSEVVERVSMAGLRQDLRTAAAAFSDLLGYAERFVEIAPWPTHFRGGYYLGSPTP